MGLCPEPGPGQRQKQKPLLSLYQARNVIPAVAGARHFLCVAKESNQRKATAGLANRGAGQEPKRTVCGIRISGRGSAGPVSQSEPARDKRPSRPVSYLRPAVANTCARLACSLQISGESNMRAPGALFIAKLQAKQTCVCPYSHPPGEGRRRGWPGLWPGLAPTEPRAPRSGVANGYPADGSFRFLTCPAIGEPRGRLSLVTFFGDAKKVTCSGHRRYHITCLVQA